MWIGGELIVVEEWKGVVGRGLWRWKCIEGVREYRGWWVKMVFFCMGKEDMGGGRVGWLERIV